MLNATRDDAWDVVVALEQESGQRLYGYALRLGVDSGRAADLVTFDIAGAAVVDASGVTVHPTRTEAQLEGVRTYVDGLQGWWIEPNDVQDAGYFARCHKDAPPQERRRLLS